MILRRLAEYADRIEIPPEMYAEVPVHWIIDLTVGGELEGFVGLDDVRMAIPARRKETEPRPLADDTKYALGVDGADKKHAAFVELARQCAEETDEAAVCAVVRFLEGFSPDQAPEELTGAHNVVFRVADQIVTDLPSVRRFWARASVRSDRVEGRCLVTGEDGHVERVLLGKVKGVRGTPGRGVSLVSAKHTPTHHYGLESSLNTPISRRVAHRYTTALNTLLRDEKSRVYIGPITYVFWTRRAEDLGDFVSFLASPDPERVRSLLLDPYRGDEQHNVEGDDFYALALSGNPGRIVVRDYLETTVPEVEANLRQWFEAQRVPDAYGQEGRPLGIFALAASCYRKDKATGKVDANNIQPRLLVGLLNTALKAQAPPAELLSRAVARNRVEQDEPVTRERAALIKTMITYERGGMDMAQQAAYNCGRLLATLEAAQAAAIPGAGVTLVEKYFSMASATPAAAFGVLLKHSQAHLGKLRRERPPLARILQTQIESITTEIGPKFPQTLPVTEQGTFALGYYRQRADDRRARREAWEAKNNQTEEVSQ